jgi:hypothetical protein
MNGICTRALITLALLFTSARAQSLLKPADAQKVDQAINQGLKGDPLSCHAEPFRPFLDFAFRFEIGYIVRCPLKQFGGEETVLDAVVRVRPAHGAAVILGDFYRIPAITPALKSTINLKRLHNEIEFSGVFTAGVGEYPVDLVVADDHHRIYRHSWSSKAVPHGDERKAAVAMPPDTVAALRLPSWHANRARKTSGLRLTVLLDASPINPYALKLRAWDWAFLLDSLSSLLNEIPFTFVRIVAFNLDQQREIFRQEQLDRSTFRKLSGALRKLELGTVSYRAVAKRDGWAELLSTLLAGEMAAQPAADAIVFLGPTVRLYRKMPAGMLNFSPDSGPKLFYFEYFPQRGSEFPDAIHHLTSAAKGKVFRLHSPGELAENIRKMQKDLQP